MKFTIKTPLPDYCKRVRVATSPKAVYTHMEGLELEGILEGCNRNLQTLFEKHKGADIFVLGVGHHKDIVAGYLLAYWDGQSGSVPILLLFRCPPEKITTALLETVADYTHEYAVKLIESNGGCAKFWGRPLSSL